MSTLVLERDLYVVRDIPPARRRPTLEDRVAELEAEVETFTRRMGRALFSSKDIEDMTELSQGMFEDSVKIQTLVERIRENTR